MRAVTLLALLTGCIRSFGQSEGYDKQSNVNSIGGMSGNTVRPVKAEHTGVKGEAFLVKEFRPAKVVMENASVFENILANIDLVENELLVKKSKTGIPMQVNKNEVKECHIHIDFDTTLVVRKIDLPKKSSQYCWVLYQNDSASILVHNRKQLIKASYSGAYNQGKNYDKLVDEVDYYLCSGNRYCKSFQPKKKPIYQLFPGQKEKIDSYIRKSSPDFRDQQQLGMFFRYMLN
jgi:hypothetical protein